MEGQIFISYSRQDLDVVKPIWDELEANGFSCLIDLEELKNDFTGQIVRAIGNASVFLFILSDNSQNSQWATNELRYARRSHKRVVLVRPNGDALTNKFAFEFGDVDIIDWHSLEQRQKLLRDMHTWLGETATRAADGRTKVPIPLREILARHLADNSLQLWENGPYWAETNIGARNPWDPGYYFWWGDTVGYQYENGVWMASDGSSSGFSFDEGNVPTYGKDNATLRREGWITAGGVLVPNHDAAHVQWGCGWRMPTQQELGALCNKCDWTWTTMNGVNGYVVCGRGDYASASIFFPAAGDVDGISLYDAGSYGYYWSSVPFSDDYYAWYLGYGSSGSCTDYDCRSYGRSIRPVQGFAK